MVLVSSAEPVLTSPSLLLLLSSTVALAVVSLAEVALAVIAEATFSLFSASETPTAFSVFK